MPTNLCHKEVDKRFFWYNLLEVLELLQCSLVTEHMDNNNNNNNTNNNNNNQFISIANRYEGQQVHIIYTEPVLARRPEQPVTNNKV